MDLTISELIPTINRLNQYHKERLQMWKDIKSGQKYLSPSINDKIFTDQLDLLKGIMGKKEFDQKWKSTSLTLPKLDSVPL